MSSLAPAVVRVTHRFRASAERVFDAWLDPAMASRFLFATPTGEMVRTEIDPRVGGTYVITERRDGEDAEHTGEYLEIDRPRRLVFTFRVPKYSQTAARVEIDIVPLETGCELTLTQTMPAEFAEYTDRSKEGWTSIIRGLAAVLGEPTAG
jgi:uncharacterized protein YndB with AHSA1/START domain